MSSLLISIVQVGRQFIILRDTREFLYGCLDGRNSIHVRQVGAHSLQFQGSPDKDLVDALSVVTPLAKHMAGRLRSLFGRLATPPEKYLDLVR